MADRGLLQAASQWSTQASLVVSHTAFLFTPCPRPPTLHLHSCAAKTQGTTPARPLHSSPAEFKKEKKKKKKT